MSTTKDTKIIFYINIQVFSISYRTSGVQGEVTFLYFIFMSKKDDEKAADEIRRKYIRVYGLKEYGERDIMEAVLDYMRLVGDNDKILSVSNKELRKLQAEYMKKQLDLIGGFGQSPDWDIIELAECVFAFRRFGVYVHDGSFYDREGELIDWQKMLV